MSLPLTSFLPDFNLHFPWDKLFVICAIAIIVLLGGISPKDLALTCLVSNISMTAYVNQACVYDSGVSRLGIHYFGTVLLVFASVLPLSFWLLLYAGVVKDRMTALQTTTTAAQEVRNPSDPLASRWYWHNYCHQRDVWNVMVGGKLRMPIAPVLTSSILVDPAPMKNEWITPQENLFSRRYFLFSVIQGVLVFVSTISFVIGVSLVFQFGSPFLNGVPCTTTVPSFNLNITSDTTFLETTCQVQGTGGFLLSYTMSLLLSFIAVVASVVKMKESWAISRGQDLIIPNDDTGGWWLLLGSSSDFQFTLWTLNYENETLLEEIELFSVNELEETGLSGEATDWVDVIGPCKLSEKEIMSEKRAMSAIRLIRSVEASSKMDLTDEEKKNVGKLLKTIKSKSDWEEFVTKRKLLETLRQELSKVDALQKAFEV